MWEMGREGRRTLTWGWFEGVVCVGFVGRWDKKTISNMLISYGPFFPHLLLFFLFLVPVCCARWDVLD